jgi:hypothetical protein
LTPTHPLEDDRRGLRTRGSTWVLLAAALAALALLAVPRAAKAQGGAMLDGAPLNVFADGLGAIQVRVDGVAAGLFYDPETNPAHAGLEIKEGERVYPLEDGFDTAPGRVSGGLQLTDLGGGAQQLSSSYGVGPNLRVSETYVYTSGTARVDVRYAIQNVSAARTSIRVGALADLFVGNNDSGNGVIRGEYPRFVGGRDEAGGLVYGLEEITPWSALQEGDFELVFENFAGDGLNNTVDSAAPDNGVGVTWQLDNLAPGETRVIAVRWLLASPAPPGTISPPRPGSREADPDGDGVIESVNGVLPPPVAGKSVNIRLSRGKVCFTPPRGKRCVALGEPVQIPVGSTIDTTKGRVTLISAADRRGMVQDAWFYEGVFKVSQTAGSSPVTVLTLAGPKLSCPSARRASAAQKRRRAKSRKLWGDGKGRFRTQGQFSSATVRGTKWVVTDRCDGTLTRVVTGSVTVRDNVRKRTVIVRAGKQYLARKSK